MPRGDNKNRKGSLRHHWVKAGPGIQKCSVCGITKQCVWEDRRTVRAVYLPSGERYQGENGTPDCRDLSEFYKNN